MIRYDYEHDFHRLMQMKWGVLILDLLIVLIAAATLGICFWIRFDLDFMVWVPLMRWFTYWNCMYVVMVTMLILLPTTLLHLFGTLAEKPWVFSVTLILNIFLVVMESVCFILQIIYGTEDSVILKEELRRIFFGLVWRSDYDEDAMRVLKMIQDWVKCCGARGAEDYIEALKPVPYECRGHVDGNEYRYGCAQKMQWWLEPWSAFLAAACMALAFLQIGQMVVTKRMARRMRTLQAAREHDKNYDDYD